MLKPTDFIATFVILLMLGCGSYELGHGKRAVPGGYDKIAVPMFKNRTPEVGIEAYFTQNLRSEFERSRLAKVVGKNEAQVILEGVISKVSYTPAAQTSNAKYDLQAPSPIPYPNHPEITSPLPDNTILNTQYATSLVVDIIARKVSDNSVLWRGSFTGQRQYLAPLLGTPRLASGAPALNTSSPLYNQSSRTDVISRMAKEMMSEAHDRLTENF